MNGEGLLIQALVYLTAGVVSVPVAKRLGLGSVLGYLLAGVVVGPFVLNLVGEARDVMRFAEFGVVFLMFSIGLGYSVGVGVMVFGDYDRLSMFAALAAAAVGSGMFASWHRYQNGGPVPGWITLILERLPFTKPRGDDND